MPRVPIISIIDDNASVRNALVGIVRSKDFIPYSFASGREFLDSPLLRDTSCIIADIQMPTMSGLELQRLLLVEFLTIPIIFVTAYPSETVRQQAFNAGAFGFFEKPFDGPEFVACLERAVGRNY